MSIRNVPSDRAVPLVDLVPDRAGQVTSRSLSSSGSGALTLFAFAAGESVSEEQYAQDALYLVLEGRACIDLPERGVELSAGEALAVPAGTQHAVRGAEKGAFKILQAIGA